MCGRVQRVTFDDVTDPVTIDDTDATRATEQPDSNTKPGSTEQPGSSANAGVPVLPQGEDPSGATELARQLRRIRGLVSGARFDDLSAEIESARELADRLEATATLVPPSEYATWGVPEHLGSNPAIGRRNPAAPPLEPTAFPDGTVRADVTLGVEYQGPPGCVHGGIVALLFDEMLGLANAAAKTIAMTVDLRVTYSSPTPLDTPLRIEARQERVDGRKIWCTGTLSAGDTVCATVEGMFVVPKWILDGNPMKPAQD